MGSDILGEAETLSPALSGELEAATQRLLVKACERDLALATAESCTGGLLASLLTDVPGVAHVFERGFVTYSEAAKTDLLGVPAACRSPPFLSGRKQGKRFDRLRANGSVFQSDKNGTYRAGPASLPAGPSGSGAIAPGAPASGGRPA